MQLQPLMHEKAYILATKNCSLFKCCDLFVDARPKVIR